jgi:hypothetical protein
MPLLYHRTRASCLADLQTALGCCPQVILYRMTNPKNQLLMVFILTLSVLAHDELGTCRACLVSPEQSVLCNSARSNNMTLHMWSTKAACKCLHVPARYLSFPQNKYLAKQQCLAHASPNNNNNVNLGSAICCSSVQSHNIYLNSETSML